MTTAFQPSAFQNNAFQIDTGPPPIPPYPDETGAGGLNVFDPSVILEYRKRIAKSQETQEEFAKRRREEREEVGLLVARAYNKALGIEEPEETSPSLPIELLPRIDEAKVAKAAREAANQIGLQFSLQQIGAMVRARKAEAMALARRQDIEARTRLLQQAEEADDAELDSMIEEAERLFATAQEMLK